MRFVGLLVLLGACEDAGDSVAPDTALDPLLPVDAPAITLTAEWLQEDLPQGSLAAGAQPGVALGDLDGDGWLDALLAYAGGSLGLRNDGAGGLVADASITVDGAAPPAAEGVALGDLDGDGDLDAVFARWGAEDLVLLNDGLARFTSTPIAGSGGATFTPTLADLDGDGDLDLALAAGSASLSFDDIVHGDATGDPNLVYRNDGGAFTLVPDALPEVGTIGITFALAAVDADDDGDIDLYSANDAGPYITPNHLLLNDGTGRFTDSGDPGSTLTMFSMGVAVGDANQDGLVDLFITNVGPPRLLVNLGGGEFAEASAAMGADIPATPESLISWGTAFVDLDADLDQDLVVAFGFGGDQQKLDAVDPAYTQSEAQPDQVLLSNGAAHYERADIGFADPGRTRAVAVGDLDRDGRPDLVTAGKHFLRQWKTSGGADAGITLRLHGSDGNTAGIGAKVEVEVLGRVATTWALPGTTGSSSAPEWYLGVHGEAAADRLRVVWPDGTESVLDEVPAGPLDVWQP